MDRDWQMNASYHLDRDTAETVLEMSRLAGCELRFLAFSDTLTGLDREHLQELIIMLSLRSFVVDLLGEAPCEEHTLPEICLSNCEICEKYKSRMKGSLFIL